MQRWPLSTGFLRGPIAHRGLHDREAGIVENTPTAVARAIEAGYGVEIDVRETADGGVVVFHDARLDRLTGETGVVSDRTTAELTRIAITGSTDRIWTLDECLDLVDGRAPLVIEIKTNWSAAADHARRVAELAARRGDPVAVKSFDPRAVRMAKLCAPAAPRGVIGEAFADDDPAWAALGARRRKAMRTLRHLRVTQPDFLSWSLGDLDRPEVAAFRASDGPVMTWTVRSPADAARAYANADQIVFESFSPVQNR